MIAERRVVWLRRSIWVVLLAGLLAFVVRGANGPADPRLGLRRPLAGFDQIAFAVHAADGNALDGCALLAADEKSRERGLMEQRDLRGYDAMVFRFGQPVRAGFYMRRTRIPLAIAFFDDAHRFVGSAEMTPCPDSVARCPITVPARPYTEAMEAPGGGLRRLLVGPGSTLTLGGGGCS